MRRLSLFHSHSHSFDGCAAFESGVTAQYITVDGVWLPKGTRAMFPMWRVATLSAQHMQSMLGGDA